MNTNYSSKFIDIIMSFAIAGMVAFFIPKGALSSYITMLMSVCLAYFFVLAQTSRQVTLLNEGLFSKVGSMIKRSYPPVIIIMILSVLIAMFSSYHKHIYDIQPPKEFITFQWVSFVLIVFELFFLFKFLKDELLETKAERTSSKTTMSKLYNFILSNLKNLLSLFSIINAMIVGIMYIIISKFITDG
uniref:DUF4149 domain-containing protein n=1 Tax=viral metagenome TaxID=1070528 RepID=A0A6C0KDS7_9ZZZZ